MEIMVPSSSERVNLLRELQTKTKQYIRKAQADLKNIEKELAKCE